MLGSDVVLFTKIIFEVVEGGLEFEEKKEDFCCGMGGDRGLKYPELTKNSIKRSVHFPLKSTIGVSSSRGINNRREQYVVIVVPDKILDAVPFLGYR